MTIDDGPIFAAVGFYAEFGLVARGTLPMPVPTADGRIEAVYEAFRGQPQDDPAVALATMSLLNAVGHDYGAFPEPLRRLAAVEPRTDHRREALRHLDGALDRFRRAGPAGLIACGLLARADIAIGLGELPPAEQDLSEALAIATHSAMQAVEIDAMLGLARLSLVAAAQPAVREQCLANARFCWQHASTLIAATGYNRRLAEASLIEAEIALASAFATGISHPAGTLASPPGERPDGGSGPSGEAGAALEAAAQAISGQKQFSLLARLEELGRDKPSFAPTLAKLQAERIAFDSEAGTATMDGDAGRAEDGGQSPVDRGVDLATQVATVLGDPELRRKTQDMLANAEARAKLARLLSDGDEGSLDDMPHEQQLAAMAAFLLSRPEDDDDEAGEDAGEHRGDDEGDVPAGRVDRQLGMAVASILGDPQGCEMVDSLLVHPEFRRALIAELEASHVPVPLDRLPREIQRKFAAAFALEKGVIALKRGDEPVN